MRLFLVGSLRQNFETDEGFQSFSPSMQMSGCGGPSFTPGKQSRVSIHTRRRNSGFILICNFTRFPGSLPHSNLANKLAAFTCRIIIYYARAVGNLQQLFVASAAEGRNGIGPTRHRRGTALLSTTIRLSVPTF